MTQNERILRDQYFILANKLLHEQFLIDKSGVKIVELLAPRIVLDPQQMSFDIGIRKTNDEYVQKELEWYSTGNLNVHPMMSDIKIWNDVAANDGTINSNYGNLVFSSENGLQFWHACDTLIKHRDSRQAMIIYQRPSMHLDWDWNGRHDFVCTNFQHLFIRDSKLHCITSMRSCDAIFGLFNDLPWFHHVIKSAYDELKKVYPKLEYGEHIYIPTSLHVYERHFPILEKMVASE